MGWNIGYNEGRPSVLALVEAAIFNMLVMAGALALIFTQDEPANQVFGLLILAGSIAGVLALRKAFVKKGIRFEKTSRVKCPACQQVTFVITYPKPSVSPECPLCGHKVSVV